jgi:hypothetical protein
MAHDAPTDADSLSRGRVVLARSLTVLGLLLALVSLVAVYVRFELLDHSTFRGTSTQLLQSEAVQSQIAASAVDALYSNVDVATQIKAQLPQAQKGLAVPIAAAFRSLAERAATQLLARPAVQRGLVNSLDFSHELLVILLKNKGRFTRVEGGVVYFDLTKLVDDLAQRLGLPADVAQRIPASASRIDLIEADELGTAQRAVRLLDFLAAWLWVFVLVSWSIAVYLVPGRRRKELRAIAIGLVIVGVLVLLVRRLAGTYAVDHLAATTSVRPAARDAYDIVTRHLADAGRTDLAVGVVALIGVWLAGPRERAQVALRWLAPYLRRPLLAYGTYVVIWLLLLVWGPTVQFRRPRYVVIMFVLGATGLEVLRRLAQRRHPDAEPTSIGASLEQWWASFRSSREMAPRAAVAAVASRPRRTEPGSEALPVEPIAPGVTDAEQLETLAALHDSGKLTDEEFSIAKRRVLA